MNQGALPFRAAMLFLFALAVARIGIAVDHGQAERVENKNVRLTTGTYNQPRARTLAEYGYFFDVSSRRPEFSHALDSLRPGDVWFDSGAGFGMAALQGARERGLHTIAVNGQDFWGDLRALHRDPAPRLIRAGRCVALVGRTPVATLERLAKAMGTQLNPCIDDRRFLSAMQSVLRAAFALRQSGNFEYRVGLVEDELAHLTERPKLFTDLYGGFFYGSRRAELIEHGFERLAPGGRMFVLLGLPTHRPDDPVRFRSEARLPPSQRHRMSLPVFLSIYNPGLVQIQTRGTLSFLVITKPDANARLVVPRYVEGQKVRFSGSPGFEHPVNIEYETDLPYIAPTVTPRRGWRYIRRVAFASSLNPAHLAGSRASKLSKA